MATDKLKKNKFDWGETVRVVDTAPHQYRNAEIGSICGIWVIDNDDIASTFNEPLGSILYIVEFPEGESQEIPEHFLERL